jgi:hypothetical protein
MKIIYPDCISSITADTSDPNYLAANLLDNHPQKVWKAGTGETTAVLTVVTNGGSVSGLHIAGTNAISGTVAVKDTSEATTFETQSISGTWGRFFVKFNTTYAVPLHIIVSLTAPVEVYAGVCRSGTFISTADPQYGLKQKRNDYSIKKELSNGGMYIFNRNIPRDYDMTFIIPIAEADLLDNLYLANGSLPLAFLLSDNINLDDQWSGFFHITEPPSIQYDYFTHTGVSMIIKEAI